MSSVEAQGRLAWFWNRLRCMTPAEVVYRAQTTAGKKLKKLAGQRQRRLQAADAAPAQTRWLTVPHDVDAAAVLTEAGDIAQGRVRLFGTTTYPVGRVPQWNRCPLTGVTAPAVPSSAISLTDRAQLGDIKFVWELNRHLHWVALAQAHALSGQPEPLAVLGEQLRAWLQQCPPDTGPNWTSSLEYALRLINWSVVWQLIDGERSSLFAGTAGQALLADWLASVQQQVLGIAEHYSRHSSANNHLIGELAGVFVAAHTWPCWSRVRALGQQARRELEQQIVLQTTQDGVNREQAFEYTAFVYDFLAVVERCATTAELPMSAAYLDRLAAMCCFIRSVMDAGGHVPQVGDADGAQVLRLHPDGAHEGFAAMLHKGAMLFGRPDWVRGLNGRGAQEARWFYSAFAGPVVASPRQPGLSFPEGGYELFESDVGTPQEIKGLVDVGALGYLGIAAHGHADALQLCLSVGGRPLLVDPGTYSYWSDKPWRDYFRGTAAHNTVRVAGQDQSVSGGRFMWTRKAAIVGLGVNRSADGSAEIAAGHDGYQRLGSRFMHRRTVRFDAASATVLVCDELDGQAPEQLELHWHFHPHWQVSLDQGVVHLRGSNCSVELVLDTAGVQGSLELLEGEESPPLGWYSARYNHRQPTKVLRWRGQARSAVLLTTIRVVWQPAGLRALTAPVACQSLHVAGPT